MPAPKTALRTPNDLKLGGDGTVILVGSLYLAAVTVSPHFC